MTVRQIWEGLLIELNKVSSPNILLQDFNYFLNKAIIQYVNKRYGVYDVNQQTTDDLRVLSSSKILTPQLITNTIGDTGFSLYGAAYEVQFPSDYLHMLNCICIYKVKKQYKCNPVGSYVQFAAKKLTSDAWSIILNDYYNRPLPQRPYYYVHNISELNEGEEPIMCEIRCGDDTSTLELYAVSVDYIKKPQIMQLTEEQLDLVEDTSQLMEFPEYVCQEIINELTMLVLENNSDPRLQTNIVVTKSIANPAQQQNK